MTIFYEKMSIKNSFREKNVECLASKTHSNEYKRQDMLNK